MTKRLVTLYKDIPGERYDIPFTFCLRHLRVFGKYTGVLVGSSEDGPHRPVGESCDVCRVDGDLGYLGFLREEGGNGG